MHSTLVNASAKTRFSIGFRVIYLDDVAGRRAAPHIDEECAGTTRRDYIRQTDLAQVADNLGALYDDETAEAGELIYEHQTRQRGL